MTGKDIFKQWAPQGEKWVDWVRPVPFVMIGEGLSPDKIHNFIITDAYYMKQMATNVAVIVDMPSYESVQEGLALAKIGFRPIPLYNGTKTQQGAMSLVDTDILEKALYWGAKELKHIEITKNAPPAFLLDSNRMHRLRVSDTSFDNSWDLYAQDMPSAEYFLNNGIDRIIVRGAKLQKDIAKILVKFRKKGISIFFTDGIGEPTAVRKGAFIRDGKI